MRQVSRRSLLQVSSATVITLAHSSSAVAVNETGRPSYIVPFTPNGFNHLVARLIVQEVNNGLGSNIMLQSIPGGDGGTRGVCAADSNSGSYSLLQISPTNFGAGDLLSRFQPISIVATSPLVICVHHTSAMASYDALIAKLRKSEPLTVGLPGPGSLAHLLLKKVLTNEGIPSERFRYNYFDGGTPTVASLLANNVEVIACNLPECIAFLQRGWLRGLAISRENSYKIDGERLIPGAKELGKTDFVQNNWTAILSRATSIVPAEVKDLILSITISQKFEQRLAEFGIETMRDNKCDPRCFIKKQFMAWERQFSIISHALECGSERIGR